MLTLQTGPIFFALIKENSENNVDDYLKKSAYEFRLDNI